MVAPRGRGDEPVDLAGPHRLDVVALALRVVVGVRDQRRVAGRAQPVLDPADDRRKERVLDVGDQDADRVGPVRLQPARHRVRPVAEALRRVAHAAHGLVVDERARRGVQRARDRPGMDPGETRHVANRHGRAHPRDYPAGDRAGAAPTPAGGRGPRGRAPRPWGRRAGGRPRPRAPPSRRPSPLRGGRPAGRPARSARRAGRCDPARLSSPRSSRRPRRAPAGPAPSRARPSGSGSARAISARAISTIFCSPPDSEPARACRRSRATIGKRSASASARRRAAPAIPEDVAAHEQHVLEHRHPAGRGCAPGERGRPRPRAPCAATGPTASSPGEADRPARRAQQAADRLQDGGLARAVGPDHAGDRAGLELRGRRRCRIRPAVAGDEPLDRQHRRHAPR